MNSITDAAEEGRISLEVSNIFFDLNDEDNPRYFNNGDDDLEDYTELPDDWFCGFDESGLPIYGKQDGFLYLTRKGWEACKEEIRKAYENSELRTKTWEDFEKYADDFLNKVDNKIKEKKGQ